jgi:hypothetical protein
VKNQEGVFYSFIERLLFHGGHLLVWDGGRRDAPLQTTLQVRAHKALGTTRHREDRLRKIDVPQAKVIAGLTEMTGDAAGKAESTPSGKQLVGTESG